MQRILVVIPCYNVDKFITNLFEDMPWDKIQRLPTKLVFLIFDDGSSDQTYNIAETVQMKYVEHSIIVLRLGKNVGYGGIQKLGFLFSKKYEFDGMILLHGDGQYSPKLICEILNPIIHDDSDLVLGSRMKIKINALRGGMPLYKWLGNIILSNVQNLLLGSKLSEFHTGYRAFSRRFLLRGPFPAFSNYYDFDTQIIIFAIENSLNISEVPIYTIYRGQISHLNGVLYSFKVLKATLIHSKIFNAFQRNKRNVDSLEEELHDNLSRILNQSIHESSFLSKICINELSKK